MSTPKGLNYSSNHEWIRLSDDGKKAVIGITDFAQLSLGDILFVNICMPGEELRTGEAFGDVESIKSVSELISPVTGICERTNDSVLETPDAINRDPYGAWLVEVSADAFGELMDAAAYDALCEKEGA